MTAFTDALSAGYGFSDPSVVIGAARFQMFFGVRDSVRDLLGAASRTLGDHRNELAVRQSLLVSVLAILVSIIGLVVGVAV